MKSPEQSLSSSSPGITGRTPNSIADLGRGLLLLVVGAAGAVIARSIGIPAGVTVGALLAGALYRSMGGVPGPWRGRFARIGKLIFGSAIGAAFAPDVLAPLRAALLPMILLAVIVVGAGLALGWVLGRTTRLDERTALISMVPGGLPAMASVAGELGADATVVATIHLVRLTTILLAVPALVPLLDPAQSGAVSTVSAIETVGASRTVITLACGLLTGLLAQRIGVPSGELIGPILAIGAANLMGAGLGPLAEEFSLVAQLLIGVAVGAQTSRESLRKLREVALPAALAVAAIITVGLLLGWVLSMVTPLDLQTALLSSVPGGASTMPAVAHDLGGDMRVIAALHLTRQLIVFAVMPWILGYLLRQRERGRVIAPEPAAEG